MSLTNVTIEKLVRNRLPFLSTGDDEVVGEFKCEVYHELGVFLGVEEADIEDDSKYDGKRKSLIADIVGCYMVFNRAIQTMTGLDGKVSSTTFAGTGLDDAVFSGVYTGTEAAVITVEIDGTGAPDTYKFNKDGGAETTTVDITGGGQVLVDGVIVKFAATTGHDLGDIWIVNLVPGLAVTGKILTKAKAGSAEVEFEQLKGGGAGSNGATAIRMQSEQLLNQLKKQAYRKARNLGLIIDICDDCSLAVEVFNDPISPSFIVTDC